MLQGIIATDFIALILDVAHDQLAHKRDKIIRYLAACVSPESLADKFLVAGLISVAIWNKAFVSGATNLEKIRPMIDVIIVKTELNAAKYYKTFIDVLKEFGDLEDVIEFIESPKYSSSGKLDICCRYSVLEETLAVYSVFLLYVGDKVLLSDFAFPL